MLRKYLLPLVALILFVACSPPAPEPQVGLAFSSAGLDRIREQVGADIDAGTIAGAVVLLEQAGETVLFESFGSRDVESGDPMRNDAIFRIYSMTKPVTSVAVMMLHERGELDIDDPAGKYLPELSGREVLVGDDVWVPADRDPTIRDLLGHTGGLTYGLFEETPVDRMYGEAGVLTRARTLAHTLELLDPLPLKHQPGTAWEYSISTDVLGRLVEVVSGRPFDEFLQQEIFEPLGMVDTGFFVPSAKLSRLATYYTPADGGLEVVEESWRKVDERPSYPSGGGGLFSTASDYLAFCRMILGGGAIGEIRLLQPASVDEMGVDLLAALPGRSEYVLRVGDWVVPGGFGLGFAVNQADTPAGPSYQLLWYGIASTMFWIDLEQELIGIYLVQRQPFDTELGHRFRELVYEAAGSAQ